MSTATASTGQKRKATSLARDSSASKKKLKFIESRNIPTQTADAALSKNGELNIASFIKARAHEIETLDRSMKKARLELSSRAFQQVPRHMRRRTASHNPKKVPRRLRARAAREMIQDNTPTVKSKNRKPSSRLRLRLETAKALHKLTQNRKTARQKKREAKTSTIQTHSATHADTIRIPKIKKNQLASPPLATSKFKRRQVSKTWLPTHLWHTKRAHMTKSLEPLWRMAIPLRPTEKSYRATHRASESRGCVAWDMSYISTIGCKGTENALEKLLKSMGFHGHGWSGAKFSKWKTGSRFAHGWVCTLEDGTPLGLVDVFWRAKPQQQHVDTMEIEGTTGDAVQINVPPRPKRIRTRLDNSIMIRAHPSAFHQIWTNLIQAAKLQKPQVLVEDLRFEIGSIDIMGPGSMEAVTSVLRPVKSDEHVQTLWDSLSTLSPGLLPADVLLSINVRDPRITQLSKGSIVERGEIHENAVNEMIAAWPLDQRPDASALFSFKARYLAGNLASQWALNRHRQTLLPGQAPQTSTKDPDIPVVLLAHRSSRADSAQQGSWTLLAPWKCIDVMWRALLYCKLSSGSKPRFGGLREKQQTAFEQCVPWFPGDYPGTDAGKAWETSQAEKRFDEWICRPPSRRIAWQSLDLGLDRRGEVGRGWSCDWECLFNDSAAVTDLHKSEAVMRRKMTETVSHSQPPLTQRQRKAARAEVASKEEMEAARRNTSSPEPDQVDQSEEIHFMQMTSTTARALMQHVDLSKLPSQPALASVRIRLLTRGTPVNAARIYRLPQLQRASQSQTLISDENQNSTAKGPVLSGTPPAAQVSPLCGSKTSSGNTSGGPDPDLRARWLSLDPHPSSGSPSKPIRKDKPNHRGLPRKAEYHAAESLRHINVLPKDAPAEIREQYRPKPLSEEEIKISIERDRAVRVAEHKTWEAHVPCPDPKDLIGFVTTGGYNLAEGKGAAIGSIWMQRVIRGWVAEHPAHVVHTEPHRAKAMDKTAKLSKDTNLRRRRERHLCIVRNAGESIGRLGIWELCE